MADTFESRLEAARGKRQFVARAANEFLAMANHDLSKVTKISWDALVATPAWCVLETHERNKLIELCGALCIAPVLKNTVDGKLFKEFQLCVGNEYFQKIFNGIEEVQAIADTSDIYLPQLSMHSNIQRAGWSVLMGTIKDTHIRNLYFKEFDSELFLFSEIESFSLYQSATNLLIEGVKTTGADVTH